MKLEINGVHLSVGQELKDYVRKKIGNLERLVPRHAKKSAHGRVILTITEDKQNPATVEGILELPHQTISAKEVGATVFSAVDLVSDKLARQIRKYKTAHSKRADQRLVRSLLGKLRRRN